MKINLSALDDNGVKVYNNRGWAYSLFSDEDMILLNEKFDEIGQDKTSPEYMLDDGSVLSEVNNKMVLLDNSRANPSIYAVLAINRPSEIYAEFFKEEVYAEFENYKRDRRTFEDLLYSIQQVFGTQTARFFSADDYGITKGNENAGQRATLPNDFQNYGYTQYAYRRKRNRIRTQQAVNIDFTNYGELDHAERRRLIFFVISV